MKGVFSKLFLTIGICISMASCGWLTKLNKPSNADNNLGSPMMKISYTMTATDWQVDSICKADKLPSLDSWIINAFKDYETDETIIKRMYIKEENGMELVYIVVGRNEPYKVTRRISN